MSRPFDMALFLRSVLTGSSSTQQRHLRQARIMQAAIQRRWQLDNPWTWQLKHVRYYYRLTTLLIWKRLGLDVKLLLGNDIILSLERRSLIQNL